MVEASRERERRDGGGGSCILILVWHLVGSIGEVLVRPGSKYTLVVWKDGRGGERRVFVYGRGTGARALARCPSAKKTPQVRRGPPGQVAGDSG